jgi:ketosteroid isomerase-like protein
MNPARTATDAPYAFGYDAASIDAAKARANLETVRRYLAAIEADTAGAATGGAAEFFDPDVVQEEFPNRFVPAGARRDLAALREAAARGRAVLRGQRYEVRAAYADGDTVILEVVWAGTLAIPVGSLAAGDEMRAYFAVFIALRDGRIYRQRNYDCFEPF